MPESENVALTPNQPRAALAETSKQVEAHQMLGRILRGSPLGLIRQISKTLPHFWEKSPGLFSSLTRSDTAGGHDSWIVGNWEVNFAFARDSPITDHEPNKPHVQLRCLLRMPIVELNGFVTGCYFFTVQLTVT